MINNTVPPTAPPIIPAVLVATAVTVSVWTRIDMYSKYFKLKQIFWILKGVGIDHCYKK